MDLRDLFVFGMDRHIPEPLAPEDGGRGRRINLGVGTKRLPADFTSVGLPHWDAETMPLPYVEESVVHIWSFHFFEHINNFIPLLAECQRVLVPGGVLTSVVPYGTCHMAIHDPTHVRFFNEDSWRNLFSCPYYVDGERGDWKFAIHTNVIMGVKGENLALVTQLLKRL